MIFADLHGKISSVTRLHERAEDVLTSTAFGLLRYLPEKDGLLPLLQLARRVRLAGDDVLVDHDPSWLPFQRWSRCDLDFWPKFGDYGEPDLRLQMFDASGSVDALILIEAKYMSPKSGQAGADEPFDPAVPDPDQLVRYWQALSRAAPQRATKAIIYLTAHAAPPTDELEQSLRRQPEAQLGWLSWRDVWRVASAACHAKPMGDLATLLGHKGLKPFTGFSRRTIGAVLGPHLFVGSRRWFTVSLHSPVPGLHLWRRR
jgi:hypothetical protein